VDGVVMGVSFIVASILDIKHTVFQVYSTDRCMKLKFPSAQKGTFRKRHLFFFFVPPQYQPLFVFIPAWALNCLKNVMLLAGDLPPRH